MQPGIRRSLQDERNALLRYALLHPPAGVTVRLPSHVKSIDECDLTSCPSPLELYAEAENSSSVRKGASKEKKPSKALVYNLAEYLTSTYQGSGGGGVTRQSSGVGHSVAESPSSASNTDRARKASEAPHGGSAASPGSSAVQRPTSAGAAAQQPPSPSKRSEKTANEADGGGEGTRHDESPSALSALVGALFGGSSTTNNASASTSAGAGGDRQPSPQQPQHRDQGGGSHFFSFLSRSKAQPASPQKNKAGSPKSVSTSGSALLNKNSESASVGTFPGAADEVPPLLPLNGTSNGLLADHVFKALEPFLGPDCTRDAKGSAGLSQGGSSLTSTTGGGVASNNASSSAVITCAMLPPSVKQPLSVEEPVVIELCPIVDQSMLSVFDESAMLTVYEHLLIAANFLLDVNKAKYETEIFSVYRTVFGISENQHMRCMMNLIPSRLREGAVDREELRLYIEGLRPDTRSLRSLTASSNDDEFISRMNLLIESVIRYSDEANSDDNGALYPLAIRASIYAIALLPIYQLNPATQKPLFQPKQIANCVETLRRKMLISSKVEEYCHLHARLLANDEGVSTSMQCVFLKHVAKAVNKLSLRSLERERLTPATKYSYYVLQETLGMAMAPMPWLETLCKTPDAMRSVSAVFMETCTVLPPCFLSAFVRVNGNLVLPPSCPTGAFLYALLSIFITAGIMRKFGDTGEALLKSAQSRCSHDRSRTLETYLTALTDLDRGARDYCKLLQRSLPLSSYLALPGRLGLGNYVLNKQWLLDAHTEPGKTSLCATNSSGPKQLASLVVPVPETIVEDVRAMMRYLAGAISPNTPSVTDEADMALVIAVAATQNLYSVGAMVRRHDEDYFGSLTAALEAPWRWSTSNTVGAGVAALPKEVQRVVQRFGMPTLAPPLATSPGELYSKRMRDYVGGVTRLAQALSLELPTPSEGGTPPPEAIARRTSSMLHFRSESRTTADGANGGAGDNVPRAYAEFQRLMQMRSSQKPLLELLQRLSALYQLRQTCIKCFSEWASQYHQLMAITGAPAVHCEGFWRQVDNTLADAISRLCQWVAAAVICVHYDREGHYDVGQVKDPAGDDSSAETNSAKQKSKEKRSKKGSKVDSTTSSTTSRSDPSVFGVAMNKFMKTDLSAYKQQKHKGLSLFGGTSAKAAAGDAPLPKAHPEITVDRLMLQLDGMLDRCVAGHVPAPLYQRAIRSYAAAFLVALLHTAYLEDVVSDVYLAPTEADGIITELDSVSRHYFNQNSNSAETDSVGTSEGQPHGPLSISERLEGDAPAAAGGCHDGSAPRGSQSLRETNGPRMLAYLRGVVRYVMWQPSATLVNGGDGVPRFSTLPEFEENTPWCKYIVKRVLARRKDKAARQAVAGKWYE